MKILKRKAGSLGLALLSIFPFLSFAQTEQDALMMGNKKLCIAGAFASNSWEKYWEGNFKRDNANIGRLETRSAILMLNYGVNNKLNVMASLPYMSTKATHGTLSGQDGFQDLGIFLKWRPIKKQSGKQTISFLTVAGYSLPIMDYNIDFMPMTIGVGSQVLSGRLIVDYKVNQVFATLSGAYMHRGNVEIDRPAYYTDHQINSSMVKMPDAGNVQLRTGYRTNLVIAEAFVDNTTTLGGFDIRKNDMPFVSNKMNSTRAGLEARYYFKKMPQLGLHANAWTTLAGRNVGEATGFTAGLDYIVDFASTKSKK
jgi:hypothetical protein